MSRGLQVLKEKYNMKGWKKMYKKTRGTLEPGEPHPEAYSAREYIAELGLSKVMLYLESFSSCALAGNRLGEICSETLDRLTKGLPVSDRYILGLAWGIKRMEENKA